MNELILESGRTEKNYWMDLWRFRELFFFLAWRDILVRYKQTAVGVAWAVLRPFLTMVIFTVIFSRVAKLPTVGTAPYAILVMAGMLPFQFISGCISLSSESMVSNANLISKIYFPRMIVPSSAVVTSFVDFLITLALMTGMMAWYRFVPDWRLTALPLFIVLSFACALGIGLWLSALMVRYRDVRHIVPFIVQFGMYVSPVGFSSNVVPEKWRLLFSLNPLVGIIDGFRWSLMRGQMELRWQVLVMSVVVTLVLFASGIWYFRKTERTFADII
jgi:lipopolysaccharide transport system permease protein